MVTLKTDPNGHAKKSMLSNRELAVVKIWVPYLILKISKINLMYINAFSLYKPSSDKVRCVVFAKFSK